MAGGRWSGAPGLVPHEATGKGPGGKLDSRREHPWYRDHGPGVTRGSGQKPCSQKRSRSRGPSPRVHARRTDSGNCHIRNRSPLFLTSFPVPGLHQEFLECDTGQEKRVPQELSLQLQVTHDDWHPQLPSPPRAPPMRGLVIISNFGVQLLGDVAHQHGQ